MSRLFRDALPAALLCALMGLSAGPATAAPLDPAQVTMPWQDFKALYDKGMAPDKPPRPAPSAYTISEADHLAEVRGDSVFIKARVRVEVVDDGGWVSVPLLSTRAALVSARVVGSRSAAPVYVRSGYYHFITDKPGPVELELEYALDLFDNAGERGFTAELPVGASTELTVRLPESAPVDFAIPNARGMQRRDTPGAQVVHATMVATSNMTVSWRRKAAELSPTADPAAPRIYAEHHALLGVGEGVLVGTSEVHYSILHHGTDRLQLRLPDDLTLLDVKGRGVRDWELGGPIGDSGVRDLRVDLDFEAEGAYTLRLEYEKTLSADEGGSTATLEAPRVQVMGVERVKGFLGVDARSNLEIDGGQTTGARAIDVRELPAGILGQTDYPVLLGFTWRDAGRTIPLTLTRHDEVDLLVTIVDQLAAETVLTPDGRRMTRATWALRNNRGQYLRVAMPEGSTPWSVFVGGRAVKPARGADGRLLVPLARSEAAGGALARFAVEVVYVEDGDAPDPRSGNGELAASLPRVDVPVTAVAWTMWMPAGAKVPRKSVEGSFRNVAAYTRVDDGGLAIPEAVEQVRRQAEASYAAAAAQGGVQPVRVTLPVDGTPLYFEKLLALDEPLDLSFRYKGLQ